MNDQLSLPLSSRGTRATEPSLSLLHLLEYLEARPAWHTARELQLHLGLGDRALRALAAASGGKIISGNHGYKHTRHATPEEFHEFYGRMTTQAREMHARAEAARKLHHQLVG